VISHGVTLQNNELILPDNTTSVLLTKTL